MNAPDPDGMVLEFDGVSFAFDVPGPQRRRPVLDGVSLDVRRGEIVSILGPSGCGKTTLLNLAAGLLMPGAGRVRAHGAPVKGPGRGRAMMFQQDALFPWLSVRGNVAFGPRCGGAAGRLDDVDALLARVGLSGFANERPSRLSGGMRQRASLARALVMHADVLLLDEPFASLDALTRETMQELVLDIHQDLRPTVVLVTHDIEEAVFMGDRVLVMPRHGGRFREEVAVRLPRPRLSAMREDPSIARLKQHLRDLLRENDASRRDA